MKIIYNIDNGEILSLVNDYQDITIVIQTYENVYNNVDYIESDIQYTRGIFIELRNNFNIINGKLIAK